MIAYLVSWQALILIAKDEWLNMEYWGMEIIERVDRNFREARKLKVGNCWGTGMLEKERNGRE